MAKTNDQIGREAAEAAVRQQHAAAHRGPFGLLRPEQVTAVPQAQGPDLTAAALQRADDAELTRAQAQLVTLRETLAEAETAQAASDQLLSYAQRAFDQAGDTPNRAIVERLAQRQREAQEAANAVGEVRRQITDAEQRRDALAGREDELRRRQLAAEKWGSACEALWKPAIHLLAALRQQRHIHDVLVDANAWWFVDDTTQLGAFDRSGADSVAPELERWLTAVSKAYPTLLTLLPAK